MSGQYKNVPKRETVQALFRGGQRQSNLENLQQLQQLNATPSKGILDYTLTNKVDDIAEVEKRQNKELVKSYLTAVQEVMMGRNNIKAIEFNLLTDQQLRDSGAVKISFETLSRNGGPGSLHDPAMGALSEKNILCSTCGLDFNLCPGHAGMMELNTKIYHPGLVKYVIFVLRIVCHSCSKLLIDRQFLIENNLLILSGLERLQALSEMFKDRRPECPAGCSGTSIYGYEATESDKTGEIHALYGKPSEGKKMILLLRDVEAILNNISDQDAELMGFSYGVHPRHFIRETWPIVPHCARMPIRFNGQLRVDQIDEHYTNILEMAYQLKTGNLTADQYQQKRIQMYQAIYKIGFGTNKEEKNSFKSLKEELGRKPGLFRANLCSARQPFCVRAVICMDPQMEVGQLGVPLKYAKILTMEVPVTRANLKLDIEKWKKMNIIETIKRDGYLQEYRTATIKHEIRVGDVVNRQLLDDDYILYVRQPVLTKHNFMGWRVKILHDPNLSTFRQGLAASEGYNYDFDGDEMTAFVIPSDEVKDLASIYANIISSINGQPIQGLFYNAVSLFYILSVEQQIFSREDFIYILSEYFPTVEYVELPPLDPDDYHDTKEEEQRYRSQYPAIYKKWYEEGLEKNNKIAWAVYYGLDPFSNRTLISTILPHDLKFSHKDVYIENGIFLTGILTGEYLKTGPNTLLQAIHQLYLTRHTLQFQRSIQFLDEAYKLINKFLDFRGYSLSIDSLKLKDKTLSKEAKVILAELELIGKELEQIKDPQREQLLHERRRKLHAHLIDLKNNTMSSNQIIALERSKLFERLKNYSDVQADPVAERRRQNHFDALIRAYEDTVEKYVNEGKLEFENQGMVNIIKSGAKGSMKTMIQAGAGGVGLQYLGGESLYAGLTRRYPSYGRLSYWSPQGDSLEQTRRLNVSAFDRGLVLSNYVEGLSAKEQFFTAPPGRINIADTNLTTPHVGYIGRRMAMTFIDVSIYPTDNTVRVVTNESQFPAIISFSFGDTFKVEELSQVSVGGKSRKSILKLDSLIADYNRSKGKGVKPVVIIITGDNNGQVYNQMLLNSKINLDTSGAPEIITGTLIVQNLVVTVILAASNQVKKLIKHLPSCHHILNLDPTRSNQFNLPQVQVTTIEGEFDLMLEIEDLITN